MASNKGRGKKKRLSAANSRAKSAPRWVDIKTFGLKRAMTRNIKGRKSRHWRRGDTGE